MDDKTLLIFAAKAASLNVEWHCPADETGEHVDFLARTEGMWLKGERSPDNSSYWNPLNNDADAFRLAVKLNLHVEIDCESSGAVGVQWGFDQSGESTGSVEQDAPEGGDDYAATRRAIVRAAAEIGKAG